MHQLKHRDWEWIKKHDPITCCLNETHFKYKNIKRIKVKEWKKLYLGNINQKKTGVAILTNIKQSKLQNKEYYQW